MPSARATFVILLAAGACAGGCISPWQGSVAKSDAARKTAAKNLPPVVPAAIDAPLTADSATADMAGVMDKLAQIREIDPAAEQKLLEQLRKLPPNSWPLVAEQFRASLAYHQQLAAKPAKPSDVVDPMAEFRRPPTSTADASHSRSLTDTPRPNADPAEPPSTAIGKLVDPKIASREDDLSLPPLTATANNDRASTGRESSLAGAPAEFAARGSVYPITAAPPSAEPAAFEAPTATPLHTATQALAVASNGAQTAAARASAKSKTGPAAGNDGEWQQLIRQAAEDLSTQVSSSPTTTAEIHQHVSLRMLRLLAGDTEHALEPIPHIPPAEQDYWSQQIFALATYLDHHSQPDDKRRAAASVTHLDEAVADLRELGSLSLRNLSFCKNVFGYGAFEAYDNDVFAPGQQLSLYVEVENYHSESTAKGYCTLLGATYELLDDKGKRVSGGDFPDVDDCCRSRRRDFHIQFGVTLPENLTPGHYRVEVVVKDRKSDKLGHATVPFEIRRGKK